MIEHLPSVLKVQSLNTSTKILKNPNFYRGHRYGNDNILEGVNFFKMYCKYVWRYHNEIPSLLMYDKSKIKKNC
jgi:hypothetical protein